MARLLAVVDLESAASSWAVVFLSTTALLMLAFSVYCRKVVKSTQTKPASQPAKPQPGESQPPVNRTPKRKSELVLHERPVVDKAIPVSVNYHMTRRCNYSCGFCFHTAKTSHVESLENAHRVFQLLRDAGTRKLNFSGGEPFLEEGGHLLGRLCKLAKQEVGFESVSIVSNGSLITKEWFEQYAAYVDILAISCDSFDDKANRAIGRIDRTRGDQVQHANQMRNVAMWCDTYDVKFKLNTVVNRHNISEDFTVPLQQLKPARWKVMQCLEVEGENSGVGARRNAQPFIVTDEEFSGFIAHHRSMGCDPVQESNEEMRNSYLILDEYFRFLDCTKGAKTPSKSILDVGVEAALLESGWDSEMFERRGGVYAWTKTTTPVDLSW